MTGYESTAQIQRDFDACQSPYNHERPRQGRVMKGRTPAQMVDAGKTQQPDPQDASAEAA